MLFHKAITMMLAAFGAAVPLARGQQNPQAAAAARPGPAAFQFHDDVAEHFHDTRAQVLMHQADAAAEHLIKASAYLQVLQGTAQAEAALCPAMGNSMAWLTGLADEIRSGKRPDPQELSRCFARSHLAAAQCHDALSRRAWLKNDSYLTGHNLQASAAHLEHALAWLQLEPDAAHAEMIQNVRLVADRLAQLGPVNPQQMPEDLQGVEPLIERFEALISERSAQAGAAPARYAAVPSEVSPGRIWGGLSGEIGRQAHLARAELLNGRPELAARRLRKVAALAELEGDPALAKIPGEVTRAAAALEELAGQMETGAAGPGAFDHAIFSLHQALGGHREKLAETAWQGRQYTAAGHHLGAAAAHLRQQAAWAGMALRPEAVAAIDRATQTGRQLVAGQAPEPAEVEEAFGQLKQLETLRRGDTPAARSTPAPQGGAPPVQD